MPIQETIRRYILFIIGVFINSLGICLIIKATLGSSPISGVPYVTSLFFPLSFGMTTLIFNLLLILGQIAILRHDFKQRDWLQLPVAFLLGVFIDLSMWLLGWVTPSGYPMQIITLLCGCAILGFGVSLEVRANVVMLAGEAFVLAVTKKSGKEFGFVKVGFDTTLTLLACAASLILFGSIEGIREGTVIAALTVGIFARYFNNKTTFIEPWLTGKHVSTSVSPDNESSHYVITIAREYGSGGREIGRNIAQSLGIAFYDKELITLAAAESNLKTDFVEQTEQTTPSNNIGELFKEDFTAPIKRGATASEALFATQSKIIRQLAAQQSCVIVGRCANFVLRDHPRRLSVFIHASHDSKLYRLTHDYGENPATAADKLEWTDAARARHCKTFTGSIWNDANNYHLSLDSGILGIPTCCQIILDAAKQTILDEKSNTSSQVSTTRK